MRMKPHKRQHSGDNTVLAMGAASSLLEPRPSGWVLSTTPIGRTEQFVLALSIFKVGGIAD